MEVSLLSKKRVDARKVWEEIQAKFDNKKLSKLQLWMLLKVV